MENRYKKTIKTHVRDVAAGRLVWLACVDCLSLWWSHCRNSFNTTLPLLSQPRQVSVGPGDLLTSPLGLSSQLLFGTRLIYTPALSATGGWADKASVFYKRLASLLSDKWGQMYSSTMNWLRCILLFSLLRSAIHCIRGSRSSKRHLAHKGSNPPIDLICLETLI